MSSKATASGSNPKVEEQTYLPSMVELLRFLRQYLEPYTMIGIERKAKELNRFPELDTRFFAKKVEMAVIAKMTTERFEMREAMERLMSDRIQLLEGFGSYNRGRVNPIRRRCRRTASEAAVELIDGLKGTIPEPKRSNWRSKASQATEENLGDFLNELEEDLLDFLSDRECAVLSRLNKKMDDFRGDLYTLSKQRRVVSKIRLAVEVMERENIEKGFKQYIMHKAIAIVKDLKRALMTPSVAKDIFQLTNTLKSVSDASSTKRFRKAVKALEATAVYLCGDIPPTDDTD